MGLSDAFSSTASLLGVQITKYQNYRANDEKRQKRRQSAGIDKTHGQTNENPREQTEIKLHLTHPLYQPYRPKSRYSDVY